MPGHLCLDHDPFLARFSGACGPRPLAALGQYKRRGWSVSQAPLDGILYTHPPAAYIQPVVLTCSDASHTFPLELTTLDHKRLEEGLRAPPEDPSACEVLAAVDCD